MRLIARNVCGGGGDGAFARTCARDSDESCLIAGGLVQTFL